MIVIVVSHGKWLEITKHPFKTVSLEFQGVMIERVTFIKVPTIEIYDFCIFLPGKSRLNLISLLRKCITHM